MKKILFTVIFIFAAVAGMAQEYKPLKAFGNDTISFLEYNFRKRAEQYKGKTLANVARDLQIPITDLVSATNYSNWEMYGVFVHIYDKSRLTKWRQDKKGYEFISIIWEQSIPKPALGKGGYNNDSLFDIFKDLKIKEIKMYFSKGSKYYQPERRSAPAKSFKEVKMEGKFVRLNIDSIFGSKSR